MPLRAVLIDSSGTLVDGSNHLVAGADASVTALRNLGLFVATGSNRLVCDLAGLTKAGAPVNAVLNLNQHGAKGSGNWIKEVARQAGCQPHEVVMVGDDKFDIAEAVNSGSALFDATWGKGCGYGIPLGSISELPYIIETFFLKQSPWYWSLNAPDATNASVEAYAVVDPNVAGIPGMKWSALGWLKDGIDTKVGKRGQTVGSFVMNHLFASLYLSGVLQRTDVWTTCPGHSAGAQNIIMSHDLARQAKMFRGVKYRELLRRAKDAPDSGENRAAGRGHLVKFDNQLATLEVSGDAKLIKGKTVLVIDDVITEGYTGEAARNLLLAAGAAHVITAAFEKYSQRYTAFGLLASGWNPRAAGGVDSSAFKSLSLSGTVDAGAQSDLVTSYQVACK